MQPQIHRRSASNLVADSSRSTIWYLDFVRHLSDLLCRHLFGQRTNRRRATRTAHPSRCTTLTRPRSYHANCSSGSWSDANAISRHYGLLRKTRIGHMSGRRHLFTPLLNVAAVKDMIYRCRIGCNSVGTAVSMGRAHLQYGTQTEISKDARWHEPPADIGRNSGVDRV